MRNNPRINVTVTVTDSAGTPVEGASVKLKEKRISGEDADATDESANLAAAYSQTYSTDSDCKAVFTNIPINMPYSVIVTHPNLNSTVKNITPLKASEKLTIKMNGTV